MAVWIIKLGTGNEYAEDCLKLGIVGIASWGNISSHQLKSHLKQIMQKDDKIDAETYIRDLSEYSYDVGYVLRFVRDAKLNDYVFCAPVWITLNDVEQRCVLLGKIISKPRVANKKESIDDYFTIVRSVKWKIFKEDELPKGLVDYVKRPQQAFSQSQRLLDHEAESLFTHGKYNYFGKLEKSYDSYFSAILESFKKLSPLEFEKYVFALLENEGWENIEHVGGPADDGIDIRGDYPLTTTINVPAFVQVKRYNKKVGKKEIENFQNALKINKIGDTYSLYFFVTSSDFTRQAEIQAKIGDPPVYLISGEKLVTMALNNYLIPYITWKPEDEDVDANRDL